MVIVADVIPYGTVQVWAGVPVKLNVSVPWPISETKIGIETDAPDVLLLLIVITSALVPGLPEYEYLILIVPVPFGTTDDEYPITETTPRVLTPEIFRVSFPLFERCISYVGLGDASESESRFISPVDTFIVAYNCSMLADIETMMGAPVPNTPVLVLMTIDPILDPSEEVAWMLIDIVTLVPGAILTVEKLVDIVKLPVLFTVIPVNCRVPVPVLVTMTFCAVPDLDW
jgi:hypothetical protein